ncbi:MAG: methyltransferase domain-containing protein [Pseudomonadota bacterium]
MQPNYDLKEEIRAFWSERSETFDESVAHRIEERHGMPEWQALVRQALDLAPGARADGVRALDLACGTGEISRLLCSLGAEVTGLDFSEDMLARATKKLSGQAWTPVLGDAERLLTLAHQSFDFAMTRHLAWTLTDPDAAYAEWFRVLRPGGRLLVNDGDWAGRNTIAYRLRRVLADLLARKPEEDEETRAEHRAIFQRLPYREGLSAERLTDALRSAGFAFVRALDTGPLYGRAMRSHGLADRLRQTRENRFSLVFERPI